MSALILARAGILLLGATLMSLELMLARRTGRTMPLAAWGLAVLLGANIGFIAFLWFNHATFPLNLDLMEGVTLQHARRAALGMPIYPEPTATYVPLAYNALYYLIAAPALWLIDSDMLALRLISILGQFGSGVLIYLLVQRRTHSVAWGLVAIGLFAAAYRTMDAYLDTAHSDSWLLCATLLGTYLIELNHGRGWNMAGVVALVVAFWFKQHGALFAIGGVLLLTWRERPARAWPYWIAAALLGPLLYALGPQVLGADFHYFTWQVPRSWSEVSLSAVWRFVSFLAGNYAPLAMAGGVFAIQSLYARRPDVIVVQFCFALLSGMMGTLDPGSSDNVYIPMGTFSIVMGSIGLYEFTQCTTQMHAYRLHMLALFASLTLFCYNPLQVISALGASDSYADLIATLNGLDGSVYLPSVGQMPADYEAFPSAHWVALEDMVRGPGRTVEDQPLTRSLLAPVINPKQHAYLLTNAPIEVFPVIAFLQSYYVLEIDYGNRFKPLRVLPKRWDHGWPRYLYHYNPTTAQFSQR